MRSYRRLAESFATSAGAAGTSASEERIERADRLTRTGYEALRRDRLAYGTPEMVAERLAQLRGELGLSGVIIEPNVEATSLVIWSLNRYAPSPRKSSPGCDEAALTASMAPCVLP